jgi:hypothetical protein
LKGEEEGTYVMKIAWTTYPFAGLPGTAKRPVSVPAGDGRLAAGISLPSERLGVATLRCLRTIEEMASEVMNMTGNGLLPAVDEDPGQALADASGGSAIARGDALVFFPGPASGRQDEDGRGELVVVKGMGLPGHAGLPQGSREEALEALAKDVAEALTRCGRGLCPVAPDNDPSRVREKFIISVDSVDGVSVPTVIHHAPSGVASVSNNNGGGELSDGAVPEDVLAIAGLLTGEAEDVPMERLRSAGDVPSGMIRSQAPQRADGSEREDTSVNIVSSLLSSPVTAMRDMGRLVQRFFATGDDGQSEETEMVDGRNGAAPPSAPDGSAVAPAEGFPSVKVTFMGNPGQVPHVDAGPAPTAPEIAGKVAALSDTINGIITGSAPAAAPRGDDAEEMEAGEEANVIMRESVRRMVAASFAGALKELTGMDGHEGAKPPGISLDERGLLKVDAAVLREALSAGKSETVRFVHDLTASLHDRIAYNPLALAGLHAGRPEALDAPSGKERASGDDTRRKVSFEKRLSEIRMLLKSSYELKDSFVQRKFTGRGDG